MINSINAMGVDVASATMFNAPTGSLMGDPTYPHSHRLITWPLIMAIVLISSAARAQQGDHAGEPQPPLPDSLLVPPSPPLTPEDALATFALPDGLRVELVAAEPLVQAPVWMDLAPDGRLWVVEMPGYMTDLDGSEELEANGRIVILADTNRDGVMDTRTVFMDEIVLPRGVAVVADGALVIAPPNLVYARDTDGDDRADELTVVDDSFQGLDSPEHAGNGLRQGLDGWLHMSQHPWEYRWRHNTLEKRRVPTHGQWGTTSDAWGRWYVNSNSYPVITDLVPKHIAVKNRAQQDRTGIAMAVPADKAVHSIRINPGVNRGYIKDTLRDDFHLRNYTAACSPEIYVDNALGQRFQGDVFVCEPAANTVEHLNLTSSPGTAGQARIDPSVGAVLASTDERFRPVALQTGSDGAMYVADMYRGILQHKIFMTSFLRQQVIDRKLIGPVNAGRIWRIVPDDDHHRALPDLTALPSSELVQQLQSPNGSIRRLAQRLLVNRNDASSIESLQLLAQSDSKDALGRAHAIWTLHALDALPQTLHAQIIHDAPWPLRVQAIRIAADDCDAPELHDALVAAMRDDVPEVRREAAAAIVDSRHPSSLMHAAQALSDHPEDTVLRMTIVSGLSGMEVALLQELAWLNPPLQQRASKMIQSIGRTAARSDDDAVRTQLLEFIAAVPPDQHWMATAVAHGVADAYALRSGDPKPVRLSGIPFDWSQRLLDEPDLAGGMLRLIDAHATWPTRPGYTPILDLTGLPPADADRMARGAALFAHCAGCHQADGRGVRGFYPPLAGSPIVTGPVEPLLSILLHGLDGPLVLEGITYNQPMPAAPMQSDEDLAAIGTYIRLAWKNSASPLTESDVARTRAAISSHVGAWTVQELHKRWK